MTKRALATTFGVGWLFLAALRLAVNYAGAVPGRTLAQLAMVVLPITAFWLPVIAAAVWIDRRPGVASRVILAMHATLAFVVGFAEPLWTRSVLAVFGMDRPYLMVFIGRFDTNVLLYGVIVVAHLALTRLQAFRARERAAARLEQALADAQLHALAIQLQPHFLFNALQFVAETAHDDLPVARRTLSHLRGLMRQAFALQQRLEVSLAEELSFLAAYGEIQKRRFGERFRLTVDVPESALRAAVPPLLLQPLVENAARHGFGSRASGGDVRVSARVDDGHISIVVADDGVGPPIQSREGQGLSVTRLRIERLHGGAATLVLAREGARTEARLRFPFREIETASEPLPTVTDMPDETPADASPRLPLGMRLAAFWSLLMALLVVATAIAPFMGPANAIAAPPPGLTRLIADEVVGLPFWLAMTLAAVLAGRRLGGARAVALHGALAVVLAGTHVLLGDYVMNAVFGVSYPRDRYEAWFTWDVLAYAALVLIARSHDLREWMRAKAREEVTLNAEVIRANARLDRLRALQADLLAELDEVIASPTMESLDAAVIAFADFLRGEVMPDVVGASS